MPQPTTHRFWRSANLPFAESRCASDSVACYAPHAHAMLSLGAVDDGMSVFQHGRQHRRLIRNDVVFIPAGETHCCNPEGNGRWSYQMLYLDTDWVTSVIQECSDLDVQDVPKPRPEIPSRIAHARLTELNATLFSQRHDSDKEAAVLTFVGDCFIPETESVARARGPSAPTALARVRALIEDRLGDTLYLNDLAAEARMSRYHLLRTFRNWTGMTPHAWQIDRRIQRARQLLDQELPLAEIAQQLGFADQSHFQRIFKQRVAVNPGEYRRLRNRNFVQD